MDIMDQVVGDIKLVHIELILYRYVLYDLVGSGYAEAYAQYEYDTNCAPNPFV